VCTSTPHDQKNSHVRTDHRSLHIAYSRCPPTFGVATGYDPCQTLSVDTGSSVGDSAQWLKGSFAQCCQRLALERNNEECTVTVRSRPSYSLSHALLEIELPYLVPYTYELPPESIASMKRSYICVQQTDRPCSRLCYVLKRILA